VELYYGVSKSFQTESITKYTLTTNKPSLRSNIKLTRLTHNTEIQLHLVAESCIICSSRNKWPVRKLLDIPSYMYILPLQQEAKLHTYKTN